MAGRVRIRMLALAALVVAAAGCSGGAGTLHVEAATSPPASPPLAVSPLGPVTVPVTGAVVGVHDPTIAKEGGTYYLYYSHGGVHVIASTDLVHWRRLPDVFSRLPTWIHATDPSFGDIWAPDLSYWKGTWHLYYAVSSPGSRSSAIGLATSPSLDPSDPRYRWVDHGQILRSTGGWVIEPPPPGQPDYNAIDPVVVAAGGVHWLAWGSYAGGIYIRKLEPDGRPDPASPAENIARRTEDLGSIEGSFLVERNGWYYLFASFDICCSGTNSTYNVRVGRSRTVTGPYVDRSGRPLLAGGGTEIVAGYGTVYGPGGESVLHDSNRWWLVTHMYNGLNAGQPELSIRPLDWSGGWPAARGWSTSVSRSR